nr:hypothetical protein [Tanacetum cinerariifolium]
MLSFMRLWTFYRKARFSMLSLQIHAKVAGKPVVIIEASIRGDLLFNDVDGIDCLTNEAIFENLALMGYEGDLTKLTFQKALFSLQWKVLALETVKDAQAKEILTLKARIKKLEKRCKPISTVKPDVDTARPDISTARQELNTAGPTTTLTTSTIFEDEEMTLVDTLINLKDDKAKGVSFKDSESTDRHARSILTLKPLLIIDPKEKRKGVMEEPESAKKMTKSDFDAAHITRYEEIVRQLEVELQADVVGLYYVLILCMLILLALELILLKNSRKHPNTNEPVSVVASVFAVNAKIHVSTLPNVDTLSNAIIYLFFASQSTSPQLDNDDLKQIDADDLEEIDLKWQMVMLTVRARQFLQRTGRNLRENGPNFIGFDMSKVECYNCHRKGHFAREYRSPKETKRNGAAEPQRRNVPIETSTSNALVSQCDGVGSYDWSFQAEDKPTNYALMAFSSSSSSSDNENLNELLASQTNDKTGLGYNSQVFTSAMFDCDNYLTSESDASLPPSPIYYRYQSGNGYHTIPPPYTGTFMLPKIDLVFHNVPNDVEAVHTTFNVELSPTKPDNDLSHTHRPSAPIIEDWVSDSEDESETQILHNVPSFVQPTEQVKSPRPSIKHVETSILTANPKTTIPKPTSKDKCRNRKACLHYANMPLLNPQRHVVPTTVVPKSKLVPINVARPITADVPKINVTRPRQDKPVVTKPNSPPKRNINHSPSPKASNFPLKVTDVKASMGNPQHALKDKGVIDSGCSRHMIGNMSCLSDFEELNGGYVAFGGNPKGGKISRKGKIRTRKLDFDDVYFVKELKFNLFSVSQMCDKKNSVLFTDTECLVLSPEFKLPDENQVLLRNTDEDAAFDEKEPGFKGRKAESEVNVSPSSSAQSKKHDDKTKREAKGKSPVESSTGYKNLSAKFEDFSDNSIIKDDSAGTLVPAVRQLSPNSTNTFSVAGPSNDAASPTHGKSLYVDSSQLPDDPNMPELEDITYSDDEDDVGVEAGFNNLETSITISLIPTIRVHKDHPVTQIIGDLSSDTQRRSMTRVAKDQEPKTVHQALKDPNWIKAMQEKPLQFKMQKIWVLVDLPHGKRAIEGHTQEEGIDYEEVFAPVVKIETIWLFLAYASFMRFMMYQMDVKSAFLYGTIKEEVYVCQPLGFEDPDYPNKVYKVVKALYGLHQDHRAWYETLANYLLENGFQRGKIDQTFFIKRQKVKQKKDGIFISKDKYVSEILRKFGLTDGKSASTPMDTKKPLLKYRDGKDIDVHTYRSMIGSLMYLTLSRLDIMFVVCACAHFQVTPKASHLHAVKRIFRYLKGKPHLGLWYPKDSPFNLVPYSDSDYASASLDRKSTIGGCQFLRCRLISWQCKKQTVVATSSTEVEYVAAASCCAQVLWIQNQLLEYGVSIPRCDEDRLEFMELMVFLLPSDKKVRTKVSAVDLQVSAVRLILLPLQALVDKTRVIITEATIRDALRLDDAEGIECIPNEEIFIKLARMGYEKPSTKLTFYKAFFSSQWNLVRNVESSTKFYMYLCFLQLMIRAQVGDLSSHTIKYSSPALTQKVFANIRTIGKGCSRVETPLFKGMIVAHQVGKGVVEVNVENVSTAVVAAEGARVKKLERRNKASKLRRLKKVGIAQKVETSDDTDMDDGRKAESQAQIYQINLEHADKVLSMQDDDLEPVELQEVVEVVTTAKLITEVVTAASTTITTAAPQLTTAAALTLATAPSAARKRKIVVIRDPEETATPPTIIHSEAKSKDKGKAKRILKLNEEVKDLKKHLMIVPNDDDDVYTEATPLSLKVPVVDYEIYTENNKPYYKIKRVDGLHQLYLSFLSMLRNFDRKDLEVLWRLPDIQAQIWKNQRSVYDQAKFKSWKLLESCSVQIITFTTTQLILLVERRYPLIRFTHSQLNKKSFKDIQGLYMKEHELIVDFVPIGSEKDERIIRDMNKKAEVESSDKGVDNTKKRKKGSRMKRMSKRQKTDVDLEEEEKLKTFLKIDPDKEGIIDYEIKTFSEMVTRFNRLDLVELYNMVMQSFESTTPEGVDLILWGDLRTMFMVNAKDELWQNQEKLSLKSWKFYENCGVNILILEDGTEIHILAERRYPLTIRTLEGMLSLRLIAESASDAAYDLLSFIQKQIDESREHDRGEKDL